MFKKFFALLTLSVLIVLASVSLTSYTEASTSEPSDVETLATNVYGPYSFTTRDVSGTAILSSHKEGVMSLLHYQDLSHYGAASVRLCNMDSGNCTGFGACQPHLSKLELLRMFCQVAITAMS